MLTPGSHASQGDVLKEHYDQYRAGIRDGAISPFTYPQSTFGAAALILFLLIPPQSPFHNVFTRYLTFAFVFYWHAWIIQNCKSPYPSAGFGIGLVCAWGTLWAATLLVFRDAKCEYRKLERHVWSSESPMVQDKAKGEEIHAVTSSATDAGLRARQTRLVSPADTATATTANKSAARSKSPSPLYYWQACSPDLSFGSRLWWVVDLVTTFRGIAWSFKIAGLPSYPLEVQRQLQTQQPRDVQTSRSGLSRFDKASAVISHSVGLVVQGYFLVDLVKTLMLHDPYFWGKGSINSPGFAWLPSILQNSVLFVRSFRLLIAMTAMWICLRTIFCTGSLLFAGLLGPKYLGVNGEPWLYPDHYGSYRNVFDRGLAGWWGGWWHQTFRYGFEEGGRWAVQVMGIQPGSRLGRMVQLVVAFSLSGYLHASGSTTQMGATSPWTGPFLFFFLQAFGLLAEAQWRIYLKTSGHLNSIPLWMGRSANFVWVHLWFFITAPLLVDDFAKGGVWLFEPIMISPLRGLGFGKDGDGWFCWAGPLPRWHADEKWWRSGLSV